MSTENREAAAGIVDAALADTTRWLRAQIEQMICTHFAALAAESQPSDEEPQREAEGG